MSDEAAPSRLEEFDLLAAAEEENTDRGVEIAGSYLRRYLCTVCQERETLATPEYAPKAICGPCLSLRTGGGGTGGSVDLSGQGHVVGYPRGTEVSRYRLLEERLPHPAPLVSSREPLSDGVAMPAVVSSLAAVGRAHGWQSLVQYSKGNGQHSITGKPLALKDTWAVRLQRGDLHAAAVYSGSWDVWIFGKETPPFGHAGLTELKEWLEARGDVPSEWFNTLEHKRRIAAERLKLKAACDRGSHGQTNTLNKVTECAYCGNSWAAGAAPWRKAKKAREHG